MTMESRKWKDQYIFEDNKIGHKWIVRSTSKITDEQYYSWMNEVQKEWKEEIANE